MPPCRASLTTESDASPIKVLATRSGPFATAKGLASWVEGTTRLHNATGGPLDRLRSGAALIALLEEQSTDWKSASQTDDVLASEREARAAEKAALDAAAKSDALRREALRLKLDDIGVPGDDVPVGDVCAISLQLADGTRLRRKFLRSRAIGDVWDWADVEGASPESGLRDPRKKVDLDAGKRRDEGESVGDVLGGGAMLVEVPVVVGGDGDGEEGGGNEERSVEP